VLCKRKQVTLLLLLTTGSVQMRWGVGLTGRSFDVFVMRLSVICPCTCMQSRTCNVQASLLLSLTAGRLLCLPHLLRSDGSWSSAVVKRWEAAEVKTTSAPSLEIGGAVEEWGLARGSGITHGLERAFLMHFKP
jgi:hypothetical protein